MKKYTCLAFLFLAGFTFAQKKVVVDDIVANVGGNVVLRSEVEQQYLQAVSQGLPKAEETKCRIMEDLMFQNLLIHQAALDSLQVLDIEVEEQLSRRIEVFTDQVGGEKELEEYLGKSLYEIKEDFRPLIRNQMLAQKMQQKLTGDVKATPSEVRAFYETLSEEELPYVETEVVVGQLVIKPEPSQEEKDRVKKEVEKLREEIINGADFGYIAIRESEDPGSKFKRGDLGWASKGNYVGEFEEAAFALEVNEISQVIETEFGFHILQLMGRRGDEIHVRHILKKPNIFNSDLRKASEKLDSIAGVVRAGDLEFGRAVAIYSNDDYSKSSGGIIMNPQTGDKKFFIEQMDPQTYFAIKDLEPGEISKSQLMTGPDKKSQFYRVVILKSRSTPHVANLSDDYDKIQQACLMKKQEEFLQGWMIKKRKITYIQLGENLWPCANVQDWVN